MSPGISPCCTASKTSLACQSDWGLRFLPAHRCHQEVDIIFRFLPEQMFITLSSLSCPISFITYQHIPELDTKLAIVTKLSSNAHLSSCVWLLFRFQCFPECDVTHWFRQNSDPDPEKKRPKCCCRWTGAACCPGFAVNRILLEQQMDGESGRFHLLKEGINHRVGSGDEAWVITSRATSPQPCIRALVKLIHLS